MYNHVAICVQKFVYLTIFVHFRLTGMKMLSVDVAPLFDLLESSRSFPNITGIYLKSYIPSSGKSLQTGTMICAIWRITITRAKWSDIHQDIKLERRPWKSYTIRNVVLSRGKYGQEVMIWACM